MPEQGSEWYLLALKCVSKVFKNAKDKYYLHTQFTYILGLPILTVYLSLRSVWLLGSQESGDRAPGVSLVCVRESRVEEARSRSTLGVGKCKRGKVRGATSDDTRQGVARHIERWAGLRLRHARKNNSSVL
jgi:hypothetical protein